MPRRLLELYSGTGSVGRAFAALGWDVVSVDLDPRANAEGEEMTEGTHRQG